jgi:hypothetical protein
MQVLKIILFVGDNNPNHHHKIGIVSSGLSLLRAGLTLFSVSLKVVMQHDFALLKLKFPIVERMLAHSYLSLLAVVGARLEQQPEDLCKLQVVSTCVYMYI